MSADSFKTVADHHLQRATEWEGVDPRASQVAAIAGVGYAILALLTHLQEGQTAIYDPNKI